MKNFFFDQNSRTCSTHQMKQYCIGNLWSKINRKSEHSTLPAIVNDGINASVGRYILKFVEASFTAWAIEIAVKRYFYREGGEKLSRMHCSNVAQSHLH